MLCGSASLCACTVRRIKLPILVQLYWLIGSVLAKTDDTHVFESDEMTPEKLLQKYTESHACVALVPAYTSASMFSAHTLSWAFSLTTKHGTRRKQNSDMAGTRC